MGRYAQWDLTLARRPTDWSTMADMLRTRSVEGALLAFDPDTGVSVRVRGPSTRGLSAGAPRAVQIAVTNHCNLACGFCYRDQSSDSAWTVDSLSTLLSDLDRAGVVEVTFGGGEPFAFKGFDELLQRLRATGLAVSVTTNGVLVDAAMLQRIEGCYAELRLSLYDDPPHRPIVDRFVTAQMDQSTGEATKLSLYTLLSATLVAALFGWELLRTQLSSTPDLAWLGFPVCLLAGRYTGLRLTEYLRFSPVGRGA